MKLKYDDNTNPYLSMIQADEDTTILNSPRSKSVVTDKIKVELTPKHDVLLKEKTENMRTSERIPKLRGNDKIHIVDDKNKLRIYFSDSSNNVGQKDSLTPHKEISYNFLNKSDSSYSSDPSEVNIRKLQMKNKFEIRSILQSQSQNIQDYVNRCKPLGYTTKKSSKSNFFQTSTNIKSKKKSSSTLTRQSRKNVLSPTNSQISLEKDLFKDSLSQNKHDHSTLANTHAVHSIINPETPCGLRNSQHYIKIDNSNANKDHKETQEVLSFPASTKRSNAIFAQSTIDSNNITLNKTPANIERFGKVIKNLKQSELNSFPYKCLKSIMQESGDIIDIKVQRQKLKLLKGLDKGIEEPHQLKDNNLRSYYDYDKAQWKHAKNISIEDFTHYITKRIDDRKKMFETMNVQKRCKNKKDSKVAYN